MVLPQLTGHKLFLTLNIGRFPIQARTFSIGWRTSIRLLVVKHSTLVHTLLTGHTIMWNLLTTSNGIPVMDNHIILLPMPVILTSATQVLVRILEKYLIKEI